MIWFFRLIRGSRQLSCLQLCRLSTLEQSSVGCDVGAVSAANWPASSLCSPKNCINCIIYCFMYCAQDRAILKSTLSMSLMTGHQDDDDDDDDASGLRSNFVHRPLQKYSLINWLTASRAQRNTVNMTCKRWVIERQRQYCGIEKIDVPRLIRVRDQWHTVSKMLTCTAHVFSSINGPAGSQIRLLHLGIRHLWRSGT